jgi:hypothetical protein
MMIFLVPEVVVGNKGKHAEITLESPPTAEGVRVGLAFGCHLREQP